MTLKEFRSLFHGADPNAEVLFRLDENLFVCTGVMHCRSAESGQTLQVKLENASTDDKLAEAFRLARRTDEEKNEYC